MVALGCDFDGCDTLPIGIDGLADMYRLADRMLTLGFVSYTHLDVYKRQASSPSCFLPSAPHSLP